MTDLSDYRKTYQKEELSEEFLQQNPIDQFKKWFDEVEKNGAADEVNAMSVSTIGTDGFPRTRVVLLKQYDSEGFVFYTNYTSEKGKAIEANPHVCLSFFWPLAERQVLIKGLAKRTTAAQSDAYFASRPKGSQLGAWCSAQSTVISNAQELQKEMLQLEEQYKNKTVQRPPHWGGYVIQPIEIEFWQGRPNRLHDRIRYTLKDEKWSIERLAP